MGYCQKTIHDWDEIPVVVHHYTDHFHHPFHYFNVPSIPHDANCGQRHHRVKGQGFDDEAHLHFGGFGFCRIDSEFRPRFFLELYFTERDSRHPRKTV